MQTSVLNGYADASGKYSTPTDRILTVNGCLATPTQWLQFDQDWQAYLKEEKFVPDDRTGRYVFHTSAFMTGNCRYMPPYLTGGVKHHKGARERIYWNLFGLIAKHTVYRFGYGVSLTDFRRFELNFPYSKDAYFKQPGTYVSKLCFLWNSRWALQTQKYNPSISYKFDRGDEFWGEMFEDYRSNRKTTTDPCVSDLSHGDKVKFSGLQAADIIAWECRKWFVELSEEHINGIRRPPRTSNEMKRINRPGKSDLRLYTYRDLESEVRTRLEEALDEQGTRGHLIGDGTPHPTIDDLARAVFVLDNEENERRKEAERDKWFARCAESRKKRNEKRQRK